MMISKKLKSSKSEKNKITTKKRTHKRHGSLPRGLARLSVRDSIQNIKSYNVKKIAESHKKKVIELYKKNVADYKRLKSNPNYYKLSHQEKEINYWYYKITYEIVLQLYLIYYNYRNMAEIKVHIPENPKTQDKVVPMIIAFLNNNQITYEYVDDTLPGRIYFYIFYPNSKLNTNNVLGIDTVENLGDFYYCKTINSDKWMEYQWRIVIHMDDIEIFAQKCETEREIAKNMLETMKIYKELLFSLQQLDSDKFGIYGIKKKVNNSNNPLKIAIYKTL
jgi:hypothetical protein